MRHCLGPCIVTVIYIALFLFSPLLIPSLLLTHNYRSKGRVLFSCSVDETVVLWSSTAIPYQEIKVGVNSLSTGMLRTPLIRRGFTNSAHALPSGASATLLTGTVGHRLSQRTSVHTQGTNRFILLPPPVTSSQLPAVNVLDAVPIGGGAVHEFNTLLCAMMLKCCANTIYGQFSVTYNTIAYCHCWTVCVTPW